MIGWVDCWPETAQQAPYALINWAVGWILTHQQADSLCNKQGVANNNNKTMRITKLGRVWVTIDPCLGGYHTPTGD